MAHGESEMGSPSRGAVIGKRHSDADVGKEDCHSSDIATLEHHVSGKVKFLTFFFLFLVWVGGWGAINIVVESVGDKV
eukprot:5959607-Amphidinium_carterae.2